MPTLPALIAHPLPGAVPGADASSPPHVVQRELSSGLPTRIDLDPTRSLVLAVPLGVASAVIAADPAAEVFTTGAASPPDPALPRADGDAWPRLTLVVTGVIGETVPVLPGVPIRLAVPDGSRGFPGVAAVEVTVDQLVITAGTLRSPGRFGGRLVLRWRDLALAADDGPASPLGDPSIPRPASLALSAAEEIR